ncbi:hypothetical protein J3E74DRAFT_294439 [Bipolaris maydis]|nr:hypothetical protein J3E73DRAFT_260433 [Bipolaris maydis]KAJ5056076.1 hypothetical protein J3E74DRAFT_294439 [Bipolaris maydis]
MRKQLRGREGAHYISSARPHHACCWLSLFGSWAPSLNSAGPFPHLVQCDTVRAKRGWARSSACGYDGRVWQLLRIAPGAGSHPMARTRSKMRQGRALAVDSLFWHREASRERRVACIVVNGTKWANAIAPLPEQLPDVDGTHVQCWHTQLHIECDVAAKPIQTTETQNAVPRQTQMGLPLAVESRLSAAASCRRQKPNEARSKVGRRSVFTSFPPSFGAQRPEMLLIFRPKHGADTTLPAPPKSSNRQFVLNPHRQLTLRIASPDSVD